MNETFSWQGVVYLSGSPHYCQGTVLGGDSMVSHTPLHRVAQGVEYTFAPVRTVSSYLKRLRRSGREKLLSALGLPSRTQVQANHKEAMYFQSFLGIRDHLGIDVPFFPFGGAANASLLYVLSRAVANLPITSVCELGAGQSTILLDALATKTPNLKIESYEQREFWADQIRAQLTNPGRVHLKFRPLKDQTVRGVTKAFYDLETDVEGKSFDLILIDGPSGEKRKSRWGSLKLIDDHLKEDFLIVFDDAERLGETDTHSEAVNLLRQKGIRFYTHTIEAQKTQLLIASERMRSACYF